MKRIMTSLVAFGLLVAACGDDTASVEAERPLPDEAALSAGLLTVSDMPAGWAVVPGSEDSDDPLCGIGIGKLLGIEEELPSAEVGFALDADRGPLVSQIVGFVPAGRGAEAMESLRAAFAACDGDSVDTYTASVGELSFPTLGDESVAYRVGLENDQIQLEIDVVYSRTGDLLVVVAAVDPLGSPSDLLEEFAPLGVERATAALL